MSEAYYGAVNDYRGYLMHHGIKGQKWGVRNGPPYPLKASDHSAAEKKAAKGLFRSKKIAGGESVKKKKPPKSDYWEYRNNSKKQMEYIKSTYDKKDLKRVKRDLKFDQNIDKIFKSLAERSQKKAKTDADRKTNQKFIDKLVKDLNTSTEMIEATKSRLKELNKMKTKDLKEALNKQYDETQKRRDAEDAKYEREQAKLAERYTETSKVIRKHFDNKENKKAFVNAVYKDLKDMLDETDMDIKKDADYIEWSWIESSINNVMQDTFSLDERMRSYKLREDYLEDIYDDLYDAVRDKIHNS